MTQVQVLTIDPRELVSFENRKAEIKERPPKGSPYKLTKEQLEVVSYVQGSCFQSVVDRITGVRYKTRLWLDNWLPFTLSSLNTVVSKELDQYLGRIIQLDGVTDVFGYVHPKYRNPPTNGAARYASTVKNFREFVKQAEVEIREGKSVTYDCNGQWNWDYTHSHKLESAYVRTEKEMIAAIAKHSAQLQAVET